MSANNDIVNGFDDEKDDSLKIRLQRTDGVDNGIVLYLTGYIDTYNSNFFQKRVSKAIVPDSTMYPPRGSGRSRRS